MNGKLTAKLLAVIMMSVFSGSSLFAHCEIPCGIYNDQLRIELIWEHITTIEKSMNEVNSLSKEGTLNYNQLVRWVSNKEDHANELQHIVTQYFMTQRVKPADLNDEAAHNAYLKKLEILHGLLVHAMKAKQTIDLENMKQLRDLADRFVDVYFDADAKKHLMEHHKG